MGERRPRWPGWGVIGLFGLAEAVLWVWLIILPALDGTLTWRLVGIFVVLLAALIAAFLRVIGLWPGGRNGTR
ncbi:MAG: hypothetical protein D6754_04645 [Alphaproteobacteria bacterium]|nr:MAG: hypothetical protein D6754_04645 [Alphaproteobacteria bacterium]